MWTVWASRAHSDQLLKDVHQISCFVNCALHQIRHVDICCLFTIFKERVKDTLKQPISSQKLYTPLINSVDQLDSGSGADQNTQAPQNAQVRLFSITVINMVKTTRNVNQIQMVNITQAQGIFFPTRQGGSDVNTRSDFNPCQIFTQITKYTIYSV